MTEEETETRLSRLVLWATILTMVHYYPVEALADQSCRLDSKRLESGIRQEYIEEGRVV